MEDVCSKQMQPAHNTGRVLVVGTTPDYIDWIRTTCPDRALFLTDPDIRKKAKETRPSEQEELVCPLDDMAMVRKNLAGHLAQWHLEITGIACFDCESMETASALAADLGLPYPEMTAIHNCRDKLISKQIWQEKGIACPKTVPVDSLEDVIAFFLQTRDGLVLKPLFGSGSELVFQCRTKKECKQAFSIVKKGLKKRENQALFKKTSSFDHLMLAEEMIEGTEFSCDFIVENNTVSIIRMTRKIKPVKRPFGTIAGYVLPSSLPSRVDDPAFNRQLLEAATALGIERSICMVDFIVRDRETVLIEITPRPGGDCIPSLLMEAGNLDILKLTLDFAEQRPIRLNGMTSFKPRIGVRIHAQKSGILKKINTDQLSNEPRVKKIKFIREPGHVITLPPKDYDSWLLGHMIIEPGKDKYVESQCLMISKRLIIEIEDS